MSMEKNELGGTVNLGITVKTADATLSKNDKVKISASNEIEVLDTAQDTVLGWVVVPNAETDGKATIAVRGKRVTTETTGAAYSAGEFVNFNSASKVIRAAGTRASGTVTISDYSAVDSGDTVTVNGVVLTAGGTDWTAATSNQATALSLATAINNLVPGVKASATSGVVTISALDMGVAGNSITLATSMTVTVEGTVSGSTLSGGKEFFPVGLALEASTGADESKDILWF